MGSLGSLGTQETPDRKDSSVFLGSAVIQVWLLLVHQAIRDPQAHLDLKEIEEIRAKILLVHQD